MKDQETFLLFVYGTLMSDGCRNGTLRGQKLLREVETLPKYRLVDLGSFPGLIPAAKEEGGQAIKGELWEVSTSLIARLDQIEGAPNFYCMETVEIAGEDKPIYGYIFKAVSKSDTFYEATRWDNFRRW